MKNACQGPHDPGPVLGMKSRRTILQGMGATGIAAICSPGWSSILPEAVRQAANHAGKKITLFNDGGFEGSAWGWQFTRNAAIESTPGKSGHYSLAIHAESGDYARFLVLGPEVGKTSPTTPISCRRNTDGCARAGCIGVSFTSTLRPCRIEFNCFTSRCSSMAHRLCFRSAEERDSVGRRRQIGSEREEVLQAAD